MSHVFDCLFPNTRNVLFLSWPTVAGPKSPYSELSRNLKAYSYLFPILFYMTGGGVGGGRVYLLIHNTIWVNSSKKGDSLPRPFVKDI